MSDRIQDAYPLAPGQGGMLFHAISAAAPGQYVIQILLELTGHPDPTREAAAWQALVDRHDALRTAFVWQGQKRPLQVVGRRARLRLSRSDLSDLSPEAQTAQFTEWLAADRARGFDVARAPLMRVEQVDLGAAGQRRVVTFHHLALDGWSIPILLRDWMALYAGRDLPAPQPFKPHVAWAEAQDRGAARGFWAEDLASDLAPDRTGLQQAGRWSLPRPATTPQQARGDLSARLGAAETEALSASLRARGVTLASAVQGVWALVQSAVHGQDEVLYGLARSGRSSAQATEAVGMFLNTLPVRLRRGEPRTPALDWLAQLQTRVLAQATHEHLPLAEVQAAARQAGAPPRFDGAVVFENYPTDPGLLGAAPISPCPRSRCANRPACR